MLNVIVLLAGHGHPSKLGISHGILQFTIHIPVECHVYTLPLTYITKERTNQNV